MLQRELSETNEDSEANGHGGKRVKGLSGLHSEDHEDYASIHRQRASAWFDHEKLSRAEEQPNEMGGGRYQIDRMEISEYYREFRIDMIDLLFLKEEDIPSETVWQAVWTSEHPDLVMRVHKNVDHKDKVILVCRPDYQICKLHSPFRCAKACVKPC